MPILEKLINILIDNFILIICNYAYTLDVNSTTLDIYTTKRIG